MKIDIKEYKRLGRYLAGECTNEEIIKIDARISRDPEYAKLVFNLKKAWSTKVISNESFDVEAAWNRLSSEIEKSEVGKKRGKEQTAIHDLNHMSLRGSGRSWFVRVAAILLVVGMTGLLLYSNLSTGEDHYNDNMREIVTEKGQRSNIHLRDGSRMILNSESKVTYERDFGDDARTVYVEGEVYFDIAHETRPFYVFTDETVIQIMGTEFNVRSYKNEDIQIAVTHGLVTVNYSESPNEDAVFLEKGDLIKLPRLRKKEPVIKRGIDLDQYIGWLQYRFTFDDTPMGEVALELERIYGVNIEFTHPELEKLIISVSFEGESIHDVLRVISLIHDIEYKMDGRTLFLSYKI